MKNYLSLACGVVALLVGLQAPSGAEAATRPAAKAERKAERPAVRKVDRTPQRQVERKPSRTVAARATRVNRTAQLARGARVAAVAAPVALAARAVEVEPPRLSVGQLQGLHETTDPLDLKSAAALVIDQDTNEVLVSKNPSAVLPIASITKLMTALVVLEARQPMDDVLTVTDDDIDTEKGSRSRLHPGTQLSRAEMLHLALMSSENRAANALGRHYPGGLAAVVAAMNRKAQLLGMQDTRYVEPTGLSSSNRSSARDLALLVREAYRQPLIRELSTSPETQVAVGPRVMQFRNTNGLIASPNWDIGLQKTGYIVEAGRCLVMQASTAGRKLIMVLLDSAGKYSRLGDAERIRRWLDGHHITSEVEPAPLRRRRDS